MESTEGEKGKTETAARKGFAAYCSHCRAETLFVHARLSNRRHLLLTLLTAGLWSMVWIALLIGKSLRPWRCSLCGWHKPEFLTTGPRPAP